MTFFRLAGHFRIEKRETGTDKLVGVREFDNTITDRGLDGYGVGGIRLLQYCYVGTGHTASTSLDVSMEQYVNCARITSNSRSPAAAPDYVSSVTCVYRFNAGTLSGNFSEIGIGNTNRNTTPNDYLWSRALIRNEQGQPSSISVLPNEYLDVYYTIYFHPPVQETNSFDLTILSTVHHVTGKMARVSSAFIGTDQDGLFAINGGVLTAVKTNSTALGDVTGTVDGVETDKSSGGYPYHPNGTLSAYTMGSHGRASVFTFGLVNDNYENGISGLEFTTNRFTSTMSIWSQYLITPPIPKTNQRELTITFQWAWARYQ